MPSLAEGSDRLVRCPDEGEHYTMGTACRWPRELAYSLALEAADPGEALREAQARAATLASAEARWDLAAVREGCSEAELASALHAVAEAEAWHSMSASPGRQRLAVWGALASDAMHLSDALAERLDLCTDDALAVAWSVSTLRAGSARQALWLDEQGRRDHAAHAARVAGELASAGSEVTERLGLAVAQAEAVWTALSGMQAKVGTGPTWTVSDRRTCKEAWRIGNALAWAQGQPASDALAVRVTDAWPTAMYERARRHGPLAMREALVAARDDAGRKRTVLAWAGLLLLARRARVDEERAVAAARTPTERSSLIRCDTVWISREVEALLAQGLRVAERDLPPGDAHTLAGRSFNGQIGEGEIVEALRVCALQGPAPAPAPEEGRALPLYVSAVDLQRKKDDDGECSPRARVRVAGTVSERWASTRQLGHLTALKDGPLRFDGDGEVRAGRLVVRLFEELFGLGLVVQEEAAASRGGLAGGRRRKVLVARLPDRVSLELRTYASTSQAMEVRRRELLDMEFKEGA